MYACHMTFLTKYRCICSLHSWSDTHENFSQMQQTIKGILCMLQIVQLFTHCILRTAFWAKSVCTHKGKEKWAWCLVSVLNLLGGNTRHNVYPQLDTFSQEKNYLSLRTTHRFAPTLRDQCSSVNSERATIIIITEEFANYCFHVLETL